MTLQLQQSGSRVTGKMIMDVPDMGQMKEDASFTIAGNSLKADEGEGFLTISADYNQLTMVMPEATVVLKRVK